jgi:sugar phosphate isomerase/epimerase
MIRAEGDAMLHHVADFGMNARTLAGPLDARLRALREAGFAQVTLAARDLVGHPLGLEAAVQAVRDSGLRVAGLQVLRDFEGLSGHLHDHKVETAQQMIGMARAVGAKALLASSSTSPHASGDLDTIACDLRKLAMLAIPHGLRIAYEGLPWGHHVSELHQAWDVVQRADCPNLGLVIDACHVVAARKSPDVLDVLDDIDPDKLCLVQLADFLWHEGSTAQGCPDTARHGRVFPGEGLHAQALAALVLKLDQIGYRGDYSFEAFHDDYQQLPPTHVAQRARRAAVWLAEGVLRRSVPLPGQMRLRSSPDLKPR